ncbi:MAG: hypothetical protein IB618_01465 [Candidatus Pacearchaeota archaeon]|nr:MAG: hypothetical protein IB618_01465 [Candidatus Pacearchaeota archaeon]
MVEEKQKKFYKKWEDYALAAYALPAYINGKVGPQQRTAAWEHLERTRGLEGILDKATREGMFDVKKALASDAEQYMKYFGELTVQEALDHVASKTGYKGQFSEMLTPYLDKQIKDLQESAQKYDEIEKKFQEAKQKYEQGLITGKEFDKISEEYSGAIKTRGKDSEALKLVGSYDRLKIEQYVLPIITKKVYEIDHREYKESREGAA